MTLQEKESQLLQRYNDLSDTATQEEHDELLEEIAIVQLMMMERGE